MDKTLLTPLTKELLKSFRIQFEEKLTTNKEFASRSPERRFMDFTGDFYCQQHVYSGNYRKDKLYSDFYCYRIRLTTYGFLCYGYSDYYAKEIWCRDEFVKFQP